MLGMFDGSLLITVKAMCEYLQLLGGRSKPF